MNMCLHNSVERRWQRRIVTSGIRRAAALVLLLMAMGCNGSTTTPTHQPATSPTPIPPPTPNFPAPAGPSRTFVFDHPQSYNVTETTKQSRFVLYDDGAFVLQYVGLGLEYRGAYTDANGVITFEWEGWSTAGAWGASGALKGDSLTVQYNLIMQLTDFEDAVYSLAR
jgi:hypothetical protein